MRSLRRGRSRRRAGGPRPRKPAAEPGRPKPARRPMPPAALVRLEEAAKSTGRTAARPSQRDARQGRDRRADRGRSHCARRRRHPIRGARASRLALRRVSCRSRRIAGPRASAGRNPAGAGGLLIPPGAAEALRPCFHRGDRGPQRVRRADDRTFPPPRRGRTRGRPRAARARPKAGRLRCRTSPGTASCR